jgi:hypothetical protein
VDRGLVARDGRSSLGWRDGGPTFRLRQTTPPCDVRSLFLCPPECHRGRPMPEPVGLPRRWRDGTRTPKSAVQDGHTACAAEIGGACIPRSRRQSRSRSRLAIPGSPPGPGECRRRRQTLAEIVPTPQETRRPIITAILVAVSGSRSWRLLLSRRARFFRGLRGQPELHGVYPVCVL